MTRQQALAGRKRIQPRVDTDIIRLAKSKAAHQELTLEYVIERLLAGWVNGKISLVEEKKTAER